jgi:hypothetical protein
MLTEIICHLFYISPLTLLVTGAIRPLHCARRKCFLRTLFHYTPAVSQNVFSALSSTTHLLFHNIFSPHSLPLHTCCFTKCFLPTVFHYTPAVSQNCFSALSSTTHLLIHKMSSLVTNMFYNYLKVIQHQMNSLY